MRRLYFCVPALVALLLLAGCSQKPTVVAADDAPDIVPGELSDVLAEAYRTRNLTMLTNLLADDPTLPPYRYFTGSYSQCAHESWGLDEELEIHRRMFDPQGVPAGDPPVALDLQPESIHITLTRSTPYAEREDLYSSEQNPGGIDAALWRVSDALFASDLLIDTQGDNGFLITGQIVLVVAEDLRPTAGEKKFVVLEWHDRGSPAANRTAAVTERSWSDVKGFYRVSQPLSACRPALSAAHLIEKLQESYRSMDVGHFWTLLAQGPAVEFQFTDNASGRNLQWGVVSEVNLHQRMFDPDNPLPGAPPPPAEYRLNAVSITLTPQGAFNERSDLYATPQNPDGLPADQWRVLEATYATDILFQTNGAFSFQVTGRSRFTVIEDRQRDIRDRGKFKLMSWVDLGMGLKASGVQETTWAEFKALYLPVQPSPIARSPEQLVQNLAEAYRTRDHEFFESILSDGQSAPEFHFILDPDVGPGDEQWGYATEVRIHQRMFEPWNTPPGQSPVPSEFWLTGIQIALTRSNAFTERTDLYESPQNPSGLSPTRWKVMDAVYATDVLFETQGDLDFQVTGRANFVVLEDLQKNVGDAGKFLLLEWNDLGVYKAAVQSKSWSELKGLYN